MKKWFAILLLALLAGIALYQLVLPKEPETGIAVGNKAPEFELPSLTGKKAGPEDFKGKKVLINFWATWCGPCQEEMPLLKSFQEKNPDIKILTVNVTANESSVEAVRNFIKKRNLTFPVALDYEGTTSGNYHVFAFPTTYFLDQNGVIQKIVKGQLTSKTLTPNF
ncbi:TlpA family protein disulfide reductase [Metabacillus sp. RGM 3146]|uniref:TlpA family protein disulfide reductase n=1 Tax=Metabacillus sp. RGM 3146 TaxID=3401092 RepID=UPI003B9CB141